jgi:adenylate kinase family enzyme
MSDLFSISLFWGPKRAKYGLKAGAFKVLFYRKQYVGLARPQAQSQLMQRIAVIGNGGGGKTTLARLLGESLDLPVHHVDSIQFEPEWRRTPAIECDRRLDELASAHRWIIDGLGRRDVIERRLKAADTVVFVDFRLLVHYWWACKRQWRNRRHQRAELPENCPEFTLRYSWVLARGMWKVHKYYRPWFLELIQRLPGKVRVFHIRSPKQWRAFAYSYAQARSEHA